MRKERLWGNIGLVFWLGLFWTIGFSFSSIIETDDFRVEELLSRFLTEHYHELRELVILDHDQMSRIYEMIHPHVPVIILGKTEITTGEGIPGMDSFLIFFDDLSILKSDITAIKSAKSWNPRARYILIAKNVTFDTLKTTCDFLWENQVGRAIFAHETSGDVRVTKCNPLRKSIESLDEVMSRNENVFEDFRNLHGYPIRESHYGQLVDTETALLLYQQVEGRYLKTVLETMNATIVHGQGKYYRDDYLKSKSYKKPFGIIVDFANRVTDVSFSSWTLVYDNNSYFDHLYPHASSESNLVIVVPKAELMSQGAKMTLQYEVAVWLAILATIFTTAIVWWIVKEKSSRSKPFWDSFQLLFAISVKPPKALRERLIFTGMTFVGIIITNAFLGRLTSLYTVLMSYKDIDTIEELCKANLRVHIGKLLYDDLIMRIRDGVPPCILDVTEPIGFQEMGMRMLRQDSTRAYIIHYQYAYRAVTRPSQYAENGHPLMHIMKEVVVPNYECFTVVRGSPYLQRINNILHRIREVGLPMYWNSMFALLNGQNLHHSTIFHRKVLTLEDIESTFILLFGGLILSFVVLLAEIGWSHRLKIQNGILKKLF